MEASIVTTGGPHKPPALTSDQEAAEFRIVSPKGSEIVGGFTDGSEDASYTISGRVDEYGPPNLRIFVRDGTDVVIAARMLRVMADELEKQKAPEGSGNVFEGVDRA